MTLSTPYTSAYRGQRPGGIRAPRRAFALCAHFLKMPNRLSPDTEKALYRASSAPTLGGQYTILDSLFLRSTLTVAAVNEARVNHL